MPERRTASPWPDALRAQLDARVEEADPRRRDVQPVAPPVLDDLRVPRDDGHTRLAAARAMERDDNAAVPSTSSPSSTTNAARSASGRAPAIARSFTVPLTASSPMSPPGKLSGRTTKESVLKAIRSEPARTSPRVAGSSSARVAQLREEELLDERVRRGRRRRRGRA